MELIEILNKHIAAAGLKKEAFATAWAESWRAACPKGQKEYTDDTVRTTLSRALKGDVPAVRFFFGQPKRAQITARQLELTDDQAAQLRQAAERHLERDGKRPTRTVLEMAPFGELRPDFWQALLDLLLAAKDAGPFELVVTEAQDERLPRLWGGFPDLIRLQKVADAGQSRAAVREAAGEEAVILSPRQYSPYERWGAMAIDSGRVRFEPQEALARIAADGGLDEPASPAHPLPEQPAVRLGENDASQMRRLAFDLTTETLTDERQPEVRAQFAAALGVRAAQTTEERLGQKLVKVDQAGLERLLRRAERVLTHPTALLVGGQQLVLVNPTPQMALVAEGTTTMVHRIEVKPTALHHLLAALDGFTVEDALDDPLLLRAVADVASEHGDSYALQHARASLLYTRAVRPQPNVHAENPDEILKALATITAPEPSLLIPTLSPESPERAAEDVMIAFRHQVDSHPLDEWKSTLSRVQWPAMKEPTSDTWRGRPRLLSPEDLFVGAPPLGAGLLDPTTSAAAWSNGEDAYSASMPRSAEQARDPAAWGDKLDGEATLQRTGNWLSTDLNKVDPAILDDMKIAFLALQRALVAGTPVPLASGKRLLPLGGGFAVEFDVLACAREAPTSIAAVANVDVKVDTITGTDAYGDEVKRKQTTVDVAWHTEHLTGRTSSGGENFVRALSALRIRHGKHVVHARFLYSPFLGGMGR